MATAAAEAAQQLLRDAETAAALTRHDRGRQDADKWVAACRREYETAVMNATTHSQIYHEVSTLQPGSAEKAWLQLTRQIEFVNEVINSQSADVASEQKIRR